MNKIYIVTGEVTEGVYTSLEEAKAYMQRQINKYPRDDSYFDPEDILFGWIVEVWDANTNRFDNGYCPDTTYFIGHYNGNLHAVSEDFYMNTCGW